MVRLWCNYETDEHVLAFCIQFGLLDKCFYSIDGQMVLDVEMVFFFRFGKCRPPASSVALGLLHDQWPSPQLLVNAE